MPVYISLFQWTDEGVKDVKNAVKRVEANIQMVQQAGGRVLGTYWTHGPYDFIAISEWPDEMMVSAAALTIAEKGKTHGMTLRAFSAEEMQHIIDTMP